MDRVLLALRKAELRRAEHKEWAARVCDGCDDPRAADLRHDAAIHRRNAEALAEVLEGEGFVFVPPHQPALNLPEPKRMH